MEEETMKTNKIDATVIQQTIPVDSEPKPISEIIEERVAKETSQSIETERFRRRYEDLNSQSAQREINKLMKMQRPQEESEFAQLMEIVAKDGIDPEGITERIDYQRYRSLRDGDDNGYLPEHLSAIRGVFARASVLLNKQLRESITSSDLYQMLYDELSDKIRSGYHYLLWQRLSDSH